MPTTTSTEACYLIIFGRTVAVVLDGTPHENNLDVVELWSGVESIAWAAIAAGFNAQG